MRFHLHHQRYLSLCPLFLNLSIPNNCSHSIFPIKINCSQPTSQVSFSQPLSPHTSSFSFTTRSKPSLYSFLRWSCLSIWHHSRHAHEYLNTSFWNNQVHLLLLQMANHKKFSFIPHLHPTSDLSGGFSTIAQELDFSEICGFCKKL